MIANQRDKFDIADGITYLTAASQSPLLRASVTAGEEGLQRKAHPWLNPRDLAAAEAEELRVLFAGLINANAADIAINPATSYGIATAAANLPLERHQSILVLEDQFSSNLFAWQKKADDAGAKMITVPRPGDFDWTSAVLDRLTAETGIVALPPCHWTDGSRLDLVRIGAASRAVGAAFVIDATQLIAAAPFDVDEIQPDFVACSGYKWLLCPYTLAFLYTAPHRQSGAPLELHSGNIDATDGRRFDMGERLNFIHLPMSVAALRQVTDWTPAAIADSLTPLTDLIAEEAAARGFVVPPKKHRVGHIIGLRRAAPPPDDIVERLAEENVHISLRGGAVRLSPYLYNDPSDIGRFFTALNKVWPA